MSPDKGTTGQAKNLAKGQGGPGQPVKIQDETKGRKVPDFDSLSLPGPRDKTGQSRKEHSKTGIHFVPGRPMTEEFVNFDKTL